MLLRETSQDCFFGLLAQNLVEYLPLIYTPVVGDACRQWSSLLRRPQGLYISIKDLVCRPHSLMPVFKKVNTCICNKRGCYCAGITILLFGSGQRGSCAAQLAGGGREDRCCDRWGAHLGPR